MTLASRTQSVALARATGTKLHGGVGDETTILHVLLDCLGQCAHEAQAPRHPADAPIEALCQGVERQAVLLMQRAQQPALLERAVGRIGVQEVSKDARRPPASPTRRRPPCHAATDADSGRACGRPPRRRLRPRSRPRWASAGRRPPTTLRAAVRARLPDAQPLIPQLELMKFQLHGPSTDDRDSATAPIASCTGGQEVGREVVSRQALPWPTGLARFRGKSARFSCQLNPLALPLVLRGAEEDPAQMAQKIGAHDTEFVLREIPGELESGGGSTNGATGGGAASASTRRCCRRCAMK